MFIILFQLEQLPQILSALIGLRATFFMNLSFVWPVYTTYFRFFSLKGSSSLPHFGSAELLGSLIEVLQDRTGFPFYQQFVRDSVFENPLKCWLEIELFREAYEGKVEGKAIQKTRISFQDDDERGRVVKFNLSSGSSKTLRQPILSPANNASVMNLAQVELIDSMHKDIDRIYAIYFQPYFSDAPCWQRAVLSEDSISRLDERDDQMFDLAQMEILDYLEENSYNYFLRSSHVKLLLAELKKQENVVDTLINNKIV